MEIMSQKKNKILEFQNIKKFTALVQYGNYKLKKEYLKNKKYVHFF